MRIRLRHVAALAGSGLVLLWTACGNTPTKPPPCVTNCEPIPVLKFEMSSVFLRPFCIQRASDVGGTPNPSLAAYNLSVFYQGGKKPGTFVWQVPDPVGSIEPKGAGLSRNDATVFIKPSDFPPLGLFDVKVVGTSGTESESLTARFAVIENTWMKHLRAIYPSGPNPPANLIQSPAWLPGPGTDPTQDEIVYVEATSALTVKLKKIQAYSPLNLPEKPPGQLYRNPEPVDPTHMDNFSIAASATPDPSPAALGRNEILFSSQLDLLVHKRCPLGVPCSAPFPFNIWVVRRPSPDNLGVPRPLTRDSLYTKIQDPRNYFLEYEYVSPRWDPSATGSRARIAFMSSRRNTTNRLLDLWTADLVDDRAPFGTSDTLENLTRLTRFGGVTSFSWHPNGSTIYYTGGPSGLNKIDPVSMADTPIPLPDTDLSRIAFVTVYWKQGEHTLVAFQATEENLTNLYVFDEDDKTLTKLLPFSFAINTNLYPRWHPTRKQLVFVSDYSVDAWSDKPDTPPPNNEIAFGQRRTKFPSVWSLRLE